MSRIINGPALDTLAAMAGSSVQCCVTSPPYWGLRDYGHDGQIGLEETPEAYVARLVAVFAQVRRVLADDGVLWLNIGDSYASGGTIAQGRNDAGNDCGGGGNREGSGNPGKQGQIRVSHGLKPKDLVGIPWRVAFALQADGWYLRSDIIWHKPNPMPESVRDRPTKAHEYVFLLSKSARYFYDADAIREKSSPNSHGGGRAHSDRYQSASGRNDGNRSMGILTDTRNARSVWTIPTQPFPGAHFAVMPPALADRCIRSGSAIGDTILDPFAGAGTTGMVARRLQREFIGIEINPTFAEMASRRIDADAPLFNREAS